MAQENTTGAKGLIGSRMPRKEGVGKVLGTALYIDDMKFESVLYGGTVRSHVPRGKVTGIHFKEGIPWDEFVIVTPEDIPGENAVTLIEKTQPFLATYVKHIAEPVAVIAHRDKYLLQKALNFIEVEIEEEDAIFDIEESLAGKNIQFGEDNVFKEFCIDHGDMNEAWSTKDILVTEGTYFTPAQEQFYIEPQGVVAQTVPGQKVTIWGSLQCPYYVQKALAPLFDLHADKIRVVQAETGGAFGGKEEYPNLLCGHAALLSWKAGGTPVKMIYDRREDLWATTKRHPALTTVKTAFTKDGKCVGLEMDFILNGGAYPTLSATVLSRGILHSFGPYVWPHANIRGRVVMTNSNPYGAFRGFGAPQSIFALELHLDKIARELGIAPEELRRRNFLKTGDRMPTGQVIKEKIDLDRLMDRALEKANYHAKVKEYEAHNKSGSPIKKGISLCTFFHGSGFTGSGEAMMGSEVAVQLTDKGGVEILSANVEYGQGTNTMFAQIASEICGIPYDWVDVHQPDTDAVPNSGPTVASRTTMIVGGMVAKALKKMIRRLREETGLKDDHSAEDFRRAAKTLLRKSGPFRETIRYEAPHDIHWDDQHYKGEAYAAYSWCCNVADVEVDMTTYFPTVKKFVSVVEAGRVINPVIATGQIEGGVVQSIGYALYEDCQMERGEMKNIQYTNYIIPTTADVTDVDVEFIEFPPDNPGPFQAKGIGELPADGPAPPIAAAIAMALGGIYIDSIPILPERIMDALGQEAAA